MYADAGLLLPFSQAFYTPDPPAPLPPCHRPHRLPPPPPDRFPTSADAPPLHVGGHGLSRACFMNQEFLSSEGPAEVALPHKRTEANLVCSSTISEYDLGEGDLFKAPEPVIEESELSLDPMTAAMSMISGGDDVMTETIKVAAMESIEEDPLLSDVFYECKKDLLAKSAIEGPIFELSDLEIPLQTEDVPFEENIWLDAEGSIQRSISAGCLNSMDWVNGSTMRPNFLDFQGLDFEAAFGMRRAFSEGDIQTIGNNNANLGKTSSIHSPFERLSTINDIKAEERKEKLSRYRRKKAKRNFGRKIKYACRKALADSQPRVRGRFAKTEDGEVSKMQ